MKKLLFISSWSIFDENKNITIPFIYEQIGALSEKVDAHFIFFQFVSLHHWLMLYVKGKWLTPVHSPWKVNQSLHVKCFQLTLPKLTTRLTENEVWEDFLWASLILGRKIIKRIGGIDLVHVHTILPVGGFALGLNKSAKVPYIIQEHTGPFTMHIGSTKKARAVRRISEIARIVLPVSKSLKADMEQYCCEKTEFRVAPNWVRTDIFKPCPTDCISSNTINIISVCSNQPVKRHWLMFETLAVLKRRGVSAVLDLYGIEQCDSVISAQVEKYGVENIVYFKGRISRDKLSAKFCDYDVYLCTSEVETFGLAPAEAICMGVPVVSTDCGGIREYIDSENGFIVNDKPTELAKAIITSKNYQLNSSQWKKLDSSFGKNAFLIFFTSIYENI